VVFGGKWSIAGVALLVSIVSALFTGATFLFNFTSLSKYTYHAADISIIDKGDLTASYDPTSHELKLSFKVNMLNSGNRDGLLTADRAQLTDSEEESDLIPFHSSDIQLVGTGKPSESFILAKDSQEQITCELRYQVSDIGRELLRKPGAKMLTVYIRGAGKPLILKYYLQSWSPSLLDSKALAQRTFYDR